MDIVYRHTTPSSLPLPLSDHKHAEVWKVSCHPKHCSLEVFLMASQVYEGNDLRGLLADFGPVQTSSVTVWFIHHLGGKNKNKS